MNYSKENDELLTKLAHNQACIFAMASTDNLPSYSFIKMYMCSKEVTLLDKHFLVSDDEIYYPIKNTIKRKGNVFNTDIMHWIGYIYRYLAYIYDISSRIIFYKVPPKYLLGVYLAYHSLDPIKAASLIYEEKLYDGETNMEKALRILKELR